jgi:hypothetical protein
MWVCSVEGIDSTSHVVGGQSTDSFDAIYGLNDLKQRYIKVLEMSPGWV